MIKTEVLPNVIGPLIYYTSDNFLLMDIIKSGNYKNNDTFIGLIEQKLIHFSAVLPDNYSEMYYKFDDDNYNTKIYIYYKSLDTSHQHLEVLTKSGGFFTISGMKFSPMSDNSLFILDKSYETNFRPDISFNMDIVNRPKEGYKKIVIGEVK
jgi:hypothetical protein|tara:strand:+ start:427 stop:882 length:456 start_codon:yes stop_codon:yes gene_type:complete